MPRSAMTPLSTTATSAADCTVDRRCCTRRHASSDYLAVFKVHNSGANCAEMLYDNILAPLADRHGYVIRHTLSLLLESQQVEMLMCDLMACSNISPRLR